MTKASLTRTEEEQSLCEELCLEHLRTSARPSESEQRVLRTAGFYNENDEVKLIRDRHVHYVMNGLRHLAPGFICLDASRPWLCYWILQSLDLLRSVEPRTTETSLLRNVIATIASFQNISGGFGGGPQQLSHCAPSYAAVLALLIVGTESAYSSIDRHALYRWFMSLKHPSGGFRMHADGEIDVRGTYTVISVASLLNILTPELTAGVAEYLLSCQTYEGGFGGEPGHEAHGGYVFCALAALVILGRAQDADIEALEAWLCNRQLSLEGGFQGRTNKLVDGCYSFWQGATGVLICMVKKGLEGQAVGWEGPIGQRAPIRVCGDEGDESHEGDESEDGHEVTVATPVSVSEPVCGSLSVNQHDLQKYILLCSQVPEGGLRDKPGKPRDFYHTCYCLSGLSSAQWGDFIGDPEPPVVLGDVSNLLPATSPVYNIKTDKVQRAIAHFARMPVSHAELMGH